MTLSNAIALLFLALADYSIAYLLVNERGLFGVFEYIRHYVGVRYSADLDLGNPDHLVQAMVIASRLRLPAMVDGDGQVTWDLPETYGITEEGWALTCIICTSFQVALLLAAGLLLSWLVGVPNQFVLALLPFSVHGIVLVLAGVGHG